MDIYCHDCGAPYSVIIWIHGGGWTNGSKDVLPCPQLGAALALAGHVVVIPNFRMEGDGDWPLSYNDMVKAVKYVMREIRKYKGGPDKIVIGGHSAGGHIASYLALRSTSLVDPEEYNYPIAGCFPVSGIFDLGECSEWTITNRVIPEFGDDPDDWDAASPINWVEGETVPFLLLYAENDSDEIIDGTAAFNSALTAYPANDITLTELEGEGHISELLGDPPPIVPHIDTFVQYLLW